MPGGKKLFHFRDNRRPYFSVKWMLVLALSFLLLVACGGDEENGPPDEPRDENGRTGDNGRTSENGPPDEPRDENGRTSENGVNDGSGLHPRCNSDEPCVLVNIVDFSTQVNDENEFYALNENGLARLKDYVDGLEFEGKTSAHEAIFRGSQLAVEIDLGPDAKRNVVFFTDGLETSSVVNQELTELHEIQFGHMDELYTIVSGVVRHRVFGSAIRNNIRTVGARIC